MTPSVPAKIYTVQQGPLAALVGVELQSLSFKLLISFFKNDAQVRKASYATLAPCLAALAAAVVATAGLAATGLAAAVLAAASRAVAAVLLLVLAALCPADAALGASAASRAAAAVLLLVLAPAALAAAVLAAAGLAVAGLAPAVLAAAFQNRKWAPRHPFQIRLLAAGPLLQQA